MVHTHNTLTARLDQCWLGDRHRFERALAKQRPGDVDDRLAQEIDASVARVDARRQRRPAVGYPPELPIAERLDDIRAAIAAHQVVVIAGETGSGKTTQIPKICLELGRGVRGYIGHTQPRRLAARTVAQRIADELRTPLGEGVGYQVRFQDAVSPHSHIKLMTDGILLAEIQSDRFLSQYDTLIIDEAHERSLNIDFLLGYLKQLLPKRPDLKLIITSATIDVERFSRYFGNAPVIEVSGRGYPVDLRYRPLEELSPDNSLAEGVEMALAELVAEGRQRSGDVLVFLSGEGEIRDVARHLRKRDLPGAEILPLYARLSNTEQNRIFDLRGRRGWRVVLATNVAETSLTVPGIHYVIDAGTARISRYSYRAKVQRLPVEPVSQASANQRAGRCGRLAPGIAIRLYSEEDFARRPAFTEPEIQRTNLAAVILQMLQLRLGDIGNFPFIDPPDRRLINDGYKLLAELGAVAGRELTALGRRMAQFPVDPRLARMLLAAADNGSLREMLVIASALSVQDPRERPADKQQASDEMHRRFRHPESDFLALVNLWQYYEDQRQSLSQNQLRKLCQREYLSWQRLREWRDVHHQLRVAAQQGRLRGNAEPADYQRVHRALLTGLLGNIARKDDEREYQGARNRRLMIFPGSALFKKGPKWIVAAELTETARLYARCVARIDPEWIFGINDDLLKRSYSEPHWQQRSGRVVAYERTTLYGLVIRDKQPVHYGAIDPLLSRQILIREALVEGQYRGKQPFFAHNQALLDEVVDLENRLRRRDLLIGDETLYRFYNERIPEGIVNAQGLDHWLKTQRRQDPQCLYLRREDLLQCAVPDSAAQFPDELEWQGLRLPLQYRFEPGHPADGVTVEIPVSVLNRLPSFRFEWLVPGLLRDKCIALVKTLPKQWRKQFVPVPEYVERALPALTPQDAPLIPALTAALKALTGVEVPADAWNADAVEPFYRMNFRILGDAGEVLGESRDLPQLLQRFAGTMQQSLARETAEQFQVVTVTDWDFGELSREHRFQQGGATVVSYPALVDRGREVAIELLDTPAAAERATRAGVVRLLLLRLAPQVKLLKARLLAGNDAQLQFAAVGEQRANWLEQLLEAAAFDTFLQGRELPRDAQQFDGVWQRGRAHFVERAEALAALLADILSRLAAVQRALKDFRELNWIHAVSDIRQQLLLLVYPGFITDLKNHELQEYPRYLAALHQRLDKLRGNLARDRQLTLTLQVLQQPLLERLGDNFAMGMDSSALRDYRWMLEEFRVSLFAQQLGTRQPVSEKRLRAQWRAVLDESPPAA